MARGHDYSETEINVVVEAMRNADPLTQGKYLTEFEDRFRKFPQRKIL